MKLVFCGTPLFAVPSLERLAAARFEIQLVVTQPDRPQGRGMALTAPPVKQSALKLGFPVIQPEKIKKNEEFQAQLNALQPDAIIVVGYGRIIPSWMLDLPPYGNINVHASLLPKYRGAAPVQWAIARGETVSGVTTMLLNEGLDTGDILMQKEMAIRPEDTALTYASRLAEMGADMIVETLRGLEDKSLTPVPQDHAKATLAPILKKEDGLVDFTPTATEIHNRLRGFQPWPGAYTQFRGKSLKMISATPEDTVSNLEPGELRVGDEKLFVGCGRHTVLQLLQVQPEGKKVMAAREFINGYHPAARERLVLTKEA
ncbi:MAG TPA: methionyl-tRNA formyltransferase [Candidatus Angelobacter sp.]|jgi:methionyl-tRNA formyltransferase|nr:methionyl-tRNA formyltransferase [Candidatus Angelobacter sp.]